MSRNYIDFISAYCDSWCERCAFTQRCSHFAVMTAETMCDGDLDAAIELAVGPPQVPGKPATRTLESRRKDALALSDEPTEREVEQCGREINERKDRLRRHTLATISHDYAIAGRRWLDRHGDVDLQEARTSTAREIIRWDLFLIHVKIMRALTGRDEDPKGGLWGSRIQNDWNGSAKVALISIERSERAFRELAAALRDEAAIALADILAGLMVQMRREFPRAVDFLRPGFDTEHT